MKEITTVGIDLAKTVFTAHGVDLAGADRVPQDDPAGKADGAHRLVTAPPDRHGSVRWGVRAWRKFEGCGQRVGIIWRDS